MRKFKLFLTVCVVMASLTIVSCKKGDTGPAGATGPAGSAGAAGATGAAGPAGTANVIYSAWLNSSFSGDTIHIGSAIDTAYFFDDSIPKLTSAIVANGEVKCYINFGTSANPVVSSLPYVNELNDINEKITPYFTTNIIELDANNDESTFTAGDGVHNQWRYILIPGGSPARSAINWNDYAAVKKYLNLKD
jgi:hypothetical protein